MSNKCCRWVHKRCSGIKGNLSDAANFRCAVYGGTQVTPVRSGRVSAKDEILECVNEFCYLGDMTGAGGRVEASPVARVRSGWKKFRNLLPSLQ